MQFASQLSSSRTAVSTSIVFVVDDDISVRESLEFLIGHAGWQPETLASAQEFLDHPRVPVPSCLIFDISLPGINGLELQKRIAKEGTDMPIIFITGHRDVPKTVQAMMAGPVEFLIVSLFRTALFCVVYRVCSREERFSVSS